MDNYDEIANYLNNSIDSYLDLVSQELIKYFSPDYKNEIISRIDSTNFIFFIKHFSSDWYDSIHRRGRIVKENYQTLRKEFINLKKVINNNDSYSPIIYNYKNEVASTLGSSQTIYDNTSTTIIFNNHYREIYIPLYLQSDEALIHEIIHSITGSVSINGEIHVGLYNNKKSETRSIEEVITQYNAKKIYKRVKNKISLVDKYYPFDNVICLYDDYINVIKNFYLKYRREINYSRFTSDKDFIIKLFGKHNYFLLLQLIDEYYWKDNYFNGNYYNKRISKTINDIDSYARKRLKN